jgi:hypothetical protein
LALVELSTALADTWQQLQAEQVAQVWVAREAELAAVEATRAVLGDEAATWAVWDGQGDGTAIGVVDGLPFTYTPATGDGGTPALLRLHRACPNCGAAWTTPVVSLRQLVGQFEDDRCGCRGRR